MADQTQSPTIRPAPLQQGDAQQGDAQTVTANVHPGIFEKLSEHFGKHGQMWLVGLGIATLVVLIMYGKHRQSAAQQAAANTAIDPTTGQPYNVQSTTPDQAWGAQLDTDYQQMISNLNAQQGTLQQILTAIQNPTTTPTPTPTPSTSLFGKGVEVFQITNKKTGKSTWYEYITGSKVNATPLASMFPKGTTFSANSSGQAFYTLPGGTPIALSEAGEYGHRYV